MWQTHFVAASCASESSAFVSCERSREIQEAIYEGLGSLLRPSRGESEARICPRSDERQRAVHATTPNLAKNLASSAWRSCSPLYA
jgi:hypothetical protein